MNDMRAQDTDAICKRRSEKEGVAHCATLLRRAILTNDALPDRYRQKTWPDYIRAPEDAYGYSQVRPPKFRPSPRDVSNMLPVMDWLCWLGGQTNGGRDAKLVMARARGVPRWRLAQRHGRSERQVQRWFDGAVAAIYGRFRKQVWEFQTSK